MEGSVLLRMSWFVLDILKCQVSWRGLRRTGAYSNQIRTRGSPGPDLSMVLNPRQFGNKQKLQWGRQQRQNKDEMGVGHGGGAGLLFRVRRLNPVQGLRITMVTATTSGLSSGWLRCDGAAHVVYKQIPELGSLNHQLPTSWMQAAFNERNSSEMTLTYVTCFISVFRTHTLSPKPHSKTPSLKGPCPACDSTTCHLAQSYALPTYVSGTLVAEVEELLFTRHRPQDKVAATEPPCGLLRCQLPVQLLVWGPLCH